MSRVRMRLTFPLRINACRSPRVDQPTAMACSNPTRSIFHNAAAAIFGIGQTRRRCSHSAIIAQRIANGTIASAIRCRTITSISAAPTIVVTRRRESRSHRLRKQHQKRSQEFHNSGRVTEPLSESNLVVELNPGRICVRLEFAAAKEDKQRKDGCAKGPVCCGVLEFQLTG